jgi:hypothetical protein
MNDAGYELTPPGPVATVAPPLPSVVLHVRPEVERAQLDWGRRLAWAGRACLIVFAAVALISANREAGLLTLGALAQISSAVRGRVEVGIVFWLAPLGLILWLLGQFVLRLAPARHVRWRVGPPVVVIPLAALLALTLAHFSPAIGLPDIVFVLAGLGLLAATYLFVLNDELSGPAIAGFVAIVGSLQALVGVAQFIVQHDLGLSWLGELTLDPSVSGVSVLGSQVRILRAYGLMRHPNALGAILSLSWLAAISLWTRSGRRDRILWLAPMALITAGLVLSFSRAGWLGALAGALVLWVVSCKAPNPTTGAACQFPWATCAPALAVAVIVVLVAVVLEPNLFLGRLFGAGSGLEYWSLFNRLSGMQSAWDVIRRWPLWGVGTRRYVIVAAQLAHMTPNEALLVDSTPLLLWAELGLAAPAAWLGMGGLLIWLGWRRTAAGAANPDLALATAWVAAVEVVCLFQAFFWPSYELWQGGIWLGVALGLWARADANSAWRSGAARPAAPAHGPGCGPALLDSRRQPGTIVLGVRRPDPR